MTVHAHFQCLSTIFLKSVGCHSDDRDLRFPTVRQSADHLRCLIAVHIGHLHIHQDQIIGARRCFFQLIHADNAILRMIHGKSHFLQKCRGDLCVQLIVLRQKHMSAGEVDLFRFLCQSFSLIILRPGDLMGHGHAELRSLPQGTLDFYGAVHQFHQTLDDGHSQTGARHLGLRRISLPGEGIKQMRKKLLTHADTGIFHHASDIDVSFPFAGKLGRRDRHGTTRWCIFHRIADDIGEDLLYLGLITQNVVMLYIYLMDQCQLFSFCLHLKDITDAADDITGLTVILVQLHPAALDPCHIQHIVDDGQQHDPRLLDHILIMQKFRIRDPSSHQPGIPQYGIHGRADVMGHVQQKGGFGRICIFCRLISHLQTFLFQGLLFLFADNSGNIKDICDPATVISLFFNKSGLMPVTVQSIVFDLYGIHRFHAFCHCRQVKKVSDCIPVIRLHKGHTEPVQLCLRIPSVADGSVHELPSVGDFLIEIIYQINAVDGIVAPTDCRYHLMLQKQFVLRIFRLL